MKSWRQIPHLYEFLAAVLFVGSVVAYAIYVPRERQIDQKWFGFAINSIFVFGMSVARSGKRQRKLLGFWLVWLLLLGIHCAAFYYVLSNVESWPSIWYVGTDGVELLVMTKTIGALLGAPTSRQGTEPQPQLSSRRHE
jgi:hypothetical protein